MNKITATFTLCSLREHNACATGYQTLLASLPADFPDDAPINLLAALKSNPVQDVWWALRAVSQDISAVLPLLAADVAELVLPIFEARFPNDDDRPRKAIAAARGEGDASCAADAAYAASSSYASSSSYAFYASSYAIYAARAAAYAARAAAYAAYAARAASCAAYAASYAADAAATDTAAVLRKYFQE